MNGRLIALMLMLSFAVVGISQAHSIVLPAGINYYQNLTYKTPSTWTTSSNTPIGFQQNITVNGMILCGSITCFDTSANDFVVFNTTTGVVLNSWLEGNVANELTTTGLNTLTLTIWTALNFKTYGASNTYANDIAIGFNTLYNNQLNTQTGESPLLSTNYGQYDNGANVFTFYDNFLGTSLAASWTASLGLTGITVANGLTLNNAGATHYELYNSHTVNLANGVVIESLTQEASTGQAVGVALGTTGNGQGGSGGADLNGGSSPALEASIGNGAAYGTFSVYANTWYVLSFQASNTAAISAYINYTNEVSYTGAGLTITNPAVDYYGSLTSAQVQWFRTRDAPPSATMPVITATGSPQAPPAAPPVFQTACGTEPSALQALTLFCLPLQIPNTQKVPILAGTQIMINFPASQYSTYLASNLQNIYLYNSLAGTTRNTFIEGNILNVTWTGSLATTKNVVMFVKLDNPINALSTNNNIYIGIGQTSTNFFTGDGNNIGIGGWLTGTYGQYDNGNTVFTCYSTFGGSLSGNAAIPQFCGNGWFEQTGTYTFGATNLTISSGGSATNNALYANSPFSANTPGNVVDTIINLNGGSGTTGLFVTQSISTPGAQARLGVQHGGNVGNKFQFNSNSISISLIPNAFTSGHPIVASISYTGTASANVYGNFSLETPTKPIVVNTIRNGQFTLLEDQLPASPTSDLSVWGVDTRTDPPNDVMPAVQMGSFTDSFYLSSAELTSSAAYETQSQSAIYGITIGPLYSTATLTLFSNGISLGSNTETITGSLQTFSIQYTIPLLTTNGLTNAYNAALTLGNTIYNPINSLTQTDYWDYLPGNSILYSNTILGDNQTIYVTINDILGLGLAQYAGVLSIGTTNNIPEYEASTYNFFSILTGFYPKAYGLTDAPKISTNTVTVNEIIQLTYQGNSVWRNTTSTFQSTNETIGPCNSIYPTNSIQWQFYNSVTLNIYGANVYFSGSYQVLKNGFVGPIIPGATAGLPAIGSATSNVYVSCIFPYWAGGPHSFNLNGTFNYSATGATSPNYYFVDQAAHNTVAYYNLTIPVYITPTTYDIAIENLSTATYLPGIIQIQQYVPSNGIGVNIGEVKTSPVSSPPTAQTTLSAGTEYKFLVYNYYNGQFITSTGFLTVASCATPPCTIIIPISSTQISTVTGTLATLPNSCALSTNPGNFETVTCTFSSTNSSIWTASLLVRPNTVFNNTVSCTKSITAITGVLTCTVGLTNNTVYNYWFTAYQTPGLTYLLQQNFFGTQVNPFGAQGIFWALIIILFFASFMASKNVVMAVGLTDAAVIGSWLLQLIPMSVGILGALQILTAFIIWVVTRD